MATNSLSRYADDYMNMRTLPAMLSVVFITFGAFAFGAIEAIQFNWFNYTFSTEHAVIVSLGAYAAAFASSETRRFESYDQWEQVAVAAGPIIIVGYEYVPQVHDFIIGLGDPLGNQIAFAITLVSWAVATQ